MNILSGGKGNKIKKKDNIQSAKNIVFDLIEKTRVIHDDESLLTDVFRVIYFLDSFQHTKKIDTIICIGDSPAIFLYILRLYWKRKYERYDKEILYLPISGLRNADNVILKNKLSELDKIFNKNEKILWVDFIATGHSFINFHKCLPKKILNNSFYYGYGYTLNNFSIYKDKNKLIKTLVKKKKMYYVEIDNTKLFRTFIRQILGGSEYYDIRCIKYSIVDKNYKLELYDNIPIKGTSNSNYCLSVAKGIFELLIGYKMI